MLRIREAARVRPRVDEDPARPEDPVDLLQGIDHAPSWNASERPRQKHDVEMLVGERQLLRHAHLEPRVRRADLARLLTREPYRPGIRIDSDDLRRVGRAPERHAAIAAADIDHALATDQADPAIFSELVLGRRTQD